MILVKSSRKLQWSTIVFRVVDVFVSGLANDCLIVEKQFKSKIDYDYSRQKGEAGAALFYVTAAKTDNFLNGGTRDGCYRTLH